MYILRHQKRDEDAIAFIGDRYLWSATLNEFLTFRDAEDDPNEVRETTLEEHQAWELYEGIFQEDGFLSMLGGGELYSSLVRLVEQMV